MNEWRKVVIPLTATIVDALMAIDRSSLQIALVVDKDFCLIGTVTDGDIRRSLLGGASLDEPVSKIMKQQFSYTLIGDGKEKALALMRSQCIHQIPVLDEGKHLVGLYTIDDILASRQIPNPVVLMAGGEGKRLQPLTRQCPKPMLNVGGKPVLESIIGTFVEQGFNSFYLSVNYMAEMIRNYFGDGSRWGININYLTEDKPLGTAGALSLLPEKPEVPIIVMNGDILTKVNYCELIEFHQLNNSLATMAVRGYQDIIPFGVVSIDNNRLIKIEEKPVRRCFVNAGIYVLSPNALEMIPQNSFFNMTDLFVKLMDNDENVTAFPIQDYWIDIGRMDDYERANGDFNQVFG
jgi:dTDP-glucose pyrophosphorylase